MGVLLQTGKQQKRPSWHAQEDPRRSYVTGERGFPGLTNVDSVSSRRSIETVGSASQRDVIHEYEIGLSVEAASFASFAAFPPDESQEGKA